MFLEPNSIRESKAYSELTPQAKESVDRYLSKLDQDELNKSERKFTNLEKAKRVAIGRVGTSNYKYKGIKIYKYVCINRKPYRVEIFSKKRGITVSSK